MQKRLYQEKLVFSDYLSLNFLLQFHILDSVNSYHLNYDLFYNYSEEISHSVRGTKIFKILVFFSHRPQLLFTEAYQLYDTEFISIFVLP